MTPRRFAADVAEAVERLGVISDETRVELDGDADAAIFGVPGRLRPVRGGSLFPLPIKGREIIGRPGARYPVRLLRLRPPSRAAGKGDHGRHFELLSELNGIPVVLIVLRGDLSLWMEGIAVAREGADLEPAGGDRLLKPFARGIVGQ